MTFNAKLSSIIILSKLSRDINVVCDSSFLKTSSIKCVVSSIYLALVDEVKRFVETRGSRLYTKALLSLYLIHDCVACSVFMPA